MLKRGGKVYVKIVLDTKTATLMPIITRKIAPDSIVFTDSYRNYNDLDVSDFSHQKINHSEKFVEDKNHINGAENFWNQSKRILRKYNGIDRNAFILFIKDEKYCFARF